MVELGRTGIMVSRLCFGTLTLGPLHLDLSPEAGGELLRRAWQEGVRFFDTAGIYGTYPHLARMLAGVPRDAAVIATKTYAAGAAEARRDVLRAARELGTDYLDLCLLHEQESALTLRGHRPALLELEMMRQEGLVRAVGLSTHYVGGVQAGAAEPLVQVIHPLLNRAGIGIRDGSAAAMLSAIQDAAAAGKGIYSMKPLAGGYLGGRAEEVLAFVRDIPYIHAVALGIGSPSELLFALAVWSGRSPPPQVARELSLERRELRVDPWCSGCGQCARRCPQGALAVAEGKLQISQSSCLRCGYCAAACSGFHLKVVSCRGPHPGR